MKGEMVRVDIENSYMHRNLYLNYVKVLITFYMDFIKIYNLDIKISTDFYSDILIIIFFSRSHFIFGDYNLNKVYIHNN